MKFRKNKENSETPRQNVRRVISNNVYLVRKVWKYTPGYVVSMIIEGVMWGLNSSMNVIFTKLVFDMLSEGRPFGEIMVPLGIWIIYQALFCALNCWHWNYFRPKLNYILNYKINAELFEKARTLDLACYDDPEFYNDFVWAMNESAGRGTEILSDLNRLIQSVIGSVATVSVLFTIDVWLALTIIGFTAARWGFQRMQFKLWHKLRKELNPLTRKRDYYARVFYMAEYSKELRTSEIGESILDDYDSNSDEIKKTSVRFGKKRYPVNQISSFLYIAGDAAVMILMVYELMVSHRVQLGGFAAAVNATWSLSWRIRNLTNLIIKFPEHSLYIEKIREFNSAEPKVVSGDAEVPDFEKLVLRGVDFSYAAAAPSRKPDGDKPPADTLHGIDMTISRGEKVAFVGYNGAGKTTLIKLLMRLYDPSGGTIEYNGRDIREYRLGEYRQRIGALFQDYKIFAATLAENVLGDRYSEEDRGRILEALHYADFDEKLSELPDGIMTALTREYDDHGVNLSGGEEQKVAIARVFANPHDILIMDEPSSALDPDAEYRLNHSILDYAREKTVIFISHRLSTTRMADRIYMFEDGAIVEAGSHDELMAMNGKYAYMFNLQAEKYL